jgi:hypothetical protein
MTRALVLGLAVVLGLGVASFAQTLSGSWDTTITITPTPVSLGVASSLVVTYSVSDWSFTSDTVLTATGWSSQNFRASGALGGFTLGSVLSFNPATASFASWTATGSLSLAGVTFNGTFTLLGSGLTPGTTFRLVGAGTAGAVDVDVTLTFGDTTTSVCDFNWTGVTIDVDFPFCCADVMSTVTFNCLGFDKATFEVQDIALPALPWVTLDALLTFQTQTKSLVLSPRFDFGDVACFSLYIAQAQTGNLTLGDITINGIGLYCEMGGVSLTGISYWGSGTKPGLLSGTPYWEAYQIATTDGGCCGPFEFDITAYFLGNGTQPGVALGTLLFDVAEVDADMSIQISSQFTFEMGIAIKLEAAPAAFTKWTLGFLVEW